MPDDPIVITSDAEKWRLVCRADELHGADEAHTNWFPIDGKFRCWSCAQARQAHPEIDPEYDQLRDRRTGRLVSRDDIVLAIERGKSATGV